VTIAPARVVFGKRAFVVSLVVAAALSAAGCGEDEQAGVEGWANSVCGNLSEWITDVDGAVKSLTEDGLALDEDDLRDAVDQARDATDELTEDLRDLGPPETPSGQRAAPTILRGTPAERQTAPAAATDGDRWQIAGGERLWLVDRETGEVRGCINQDTFTVGVRVIRCTSGELGRFSRTFGPDFQP